MDLQIFIFILKTSNTGILLQHTLQLVSLATRHISITSVVNKTYTNIVSGGFGAGPKNLVFITLGIFRLSAIICIFRVLFKFYQLRQIMALNSLDICNSIALNSNREPGVLVRCEGGRPKVFLFFYTSS